MTIIFLIGLAIAIIVATVLIIRCILKKLHDDTKPLATTGTKVPEPPVTRSQLNDTDDMSL